MRRKKELAKRTVKVTEISYSRLAKTDQYENHRIELVAEVGPDQNIFEVANKLKANAAKILGLDYDQPSCGCPDSQFDYCPKCGTSLI